MKKIPLYLILILLAVVLLRIPSLFEPYSYGDEGIYLTLGEAARQGLVFYRDIHDNKPPLLYLLAMVTGNLFWFRLLLLFWNLLTITLFDHFLNYLFPESKKANIVLVFTFGLLTSIPLLEGNIANAEVFMILPIVAATIFIWQKFQSWNFSYFCAGLLFSTAALFKIPAAFDFAAIVFFLVFFLRPKKFLAYTFYILLGFALPIFMSFLYYWSQDSLPQYFTAAFAQNLPYLSSWEGQRTSIFESGIVRRGFILLFSLAALWLLRKKLTIVSLFAATWFLFSLFGTTLSGRPYPHYLMQIVPSAVFLSALFFQKNYLSKIIALSFYLLIILTTVYFKFWSYPTVNYYQNFLSYLLRTQTKEQYFASFGGNVPHNYYLAQFLITHTRPDEKTFIWGDSPIVYALAKRLPAGRYTASYHINDFNGYEETIKVLNQIQPVYIIDLNDDHHPFPQFEELLKKDYVFQENYHQAEIYKRNKL